jgi:hypothetical protein
MPLKFTSLYFDSFRDLFSLAFQQSSSNLIKSPILTQTTLSISSWGTFQILLVGTINLANLHVGYHILIQKVYIDLSPYRLFNMSIQ